MRGSTPGTQKTFSMCRFVIPYQKELHRGIIASEVAERMGVGRSDSVATATTAMHLLMLFPALGLSYCTTGVQNKLCETNFPCLAANGLKAASSPHK